MPNLGDHSLAVVAPNGAARVSKRFLIQAIYPLRRYEDWLALLERLDGRQALLTGPELARPIIR